jgi:hypothetical protein
MPSTFAEKTRELEERVGDGRIVGRVSFSPQKIAVPQHRGTWMSGPLAGVVIKHWTTPGTGPGYLVDPLLENGERYFAEIAREVLMAGARAPMLRAVNDLLDEAQRRVPRKTGKLAETGDASVSEELVGAALG